MVSRPILFACILAHCPIVSNAQAQNKSVEYFAPGTPNALSLCAKVQASAYSLLHGRAIPNHPKISRAWDIVTEATPHFFDTLGLPGRMAFAALPRSIVEKKGIGEQVRALRDELKKTGQFSPLRDRRVRKALIYMTRCGIFEAFAQQNKDTLRFCRETRRSAMCRACAVYQKLIAQAIEMFCLDNGGKWTRGEAIDQRELKGYLERVYVCPLTRKPSYFINNEGEVSCSHHGNQKRALKSAAVRGFDVSQEVNRLWKNNAVFRALDGELRKVSPDGKGLIRVR